MKNLKLVLMLFLGVLASGSLMANGNLMTNGNLRVDIIPAIKGVKDQVQVNVLESPDSQVKVELKDSNGHVILAETKDPSTSDYKKLYDFSKLANGKYTFEVNTGGEMEIDNVYVKNGSVRIINQQDQISPVFKADGKFLKFTFPNSVDKTARLLLYDNDTNKLVFQETLDPQFDVKQTLDLDGLSTGNYKAVLISDHDTFNYNFYIG